MPTEMTGGELVVKMLVSLGVSHVFGIPGGQTLAITDAMIDNPDIDFITARHEGSAAVMADAYGRLTGTPGVCLSTTGPGATNLLTGVGGALRDSSPVLVITCNNKSEDIEKDDAQNANHVEIFRPLTKWSRLVTHGTSIAVSIEEAYVNAMSGTPGPVLLDFARDAIEGAVSAADIPAVHPARAWVAQRPIPAPASVAIAAQQIGAALRPALWLGNGCANPAASAAALAFAEALNVPVITTFGGIGAVPTRHPMVFGSLSRMGTALSSRVLSDSDLVIAVGNSLNAVSTGRWTMDLPPIVQIDVEPTKIGRYYGDRTFGLVGDAAPTLEALLDKLKADDKAVAAVECRREWVTELQGHAKRWWQQAEDDAITIVKTPSGNSALLSPAHLVVALRQMAPDDTLLIPDAGNPGVWSYLWDVRTVGSYIKPVGFGNMGFAVPAAIASATIDPTRPTLVLVGDGSLGMTLGELETVARIGGRVAIVVLNDQGYGNIRQEQVYKYGQRNIGVDFGPSNYAQVAEGLGLAGHTVTDPATLAELVGRTLRGDKPALFDVHIDPDISVWTFPAFRAFHPVEG